MCGPVSVNFNGRVASAFARAQAAGRSSVPGPIGASTTPGGRAAEFAIRRACLNASHSASPISLRTPGHRPHEILDHAVGLGMIDVEAIKLAVAHQIDPGLLLGVDHDARRVDQRLLGWQRHQPVRHRIGADGGGENACVLLLLADIG